MNIVFTKRVKIAVLMFRLRTASEDCSKSVESASRQWW